MAIDNLIMNAWAEAATDLGIRVVTPYEFTSEDGQILFFEAFVLDFGSSNGAIVMSETSRDNIVAAKAWASTLFESYQTYDRQHFVETLNDWGWYGDKLKTPAWYSGEPWTEL